MSKDGIDNLVARMSPLFNQLRELQAEADRRGIFFADRELLSCSACGLAEDVLIDGRLITYKGDPPGVDTGLRFEDIDDGLHFRCPSCGAIVRPEEEEEV